MNKTIGRIGIMIVCLTAIACWIYFELPHQKRGDEKLQDEDTANLIFRILENNIPLQDLKTNIGDSTVKYTDDSTNFINILKNQETINVSIGNITPLSTTEFLSMSYKKTTFNNYKNYLKNNNNLSNWESNVKSLNANNDFNLYELAGYINEVGFFTTNISTYYYLKTDEPHNASSILFSITDSTETYISEKNSYYKIHTVNLFQLLADKLFTENKNYYLTTGDYFIFASDTTQLYNLYLSLDTGSILMNNSSYSDYKSNQFSEYGLHYYSDITKEDDSNNTIISYQLRGESTMVTTHLNIFKFKKREDMIIDSLFMDTTTDTLTEEEKIIIIEEKTNTTTENQEEEIGEITYTLVDGETFREATVKLKAELEKGGYDYNKVKQEHVFFIIDSGKTKLNWNTAVKRYLDKKQPTGGDYFFMKKFFY